MNCSSRNWSLSFLLFSVFIYACSTENYAGNQGKKTLYLPAKIDRIPEGNNFNDNNSEFSYKRMVESENLALFWDKEYGDNPMNNPDEKKRFDVKRHLPNASGFTIIMWMN